MLIQRRYYRPSGMGDIGWPDFLDNAVSYVADKVVSGSTAVVNAGKATVGAVGSGVGWTGSKLWGGGKAIVGNAGTIAKVALPMFYIPAKVGFEVGKYGVGKLRSIGGGGGGDEAPPPPPPSDAAPATVSRWGAAIPPEQRKSILSMATSLARQVTPSTSQGEAPAAPVPSQQVTTTAAAGGGGGGGGGASSEDISTVTSGLIADPSQAEAETSFMGKIAALSMPVKIAGGVAILGGLYFVYRSLSSRGGGTGRRSKS